MMMAVKQYNYTWMDPHYLPGELWAPRLDRDDYDEPADYRFKTEGHARAWFATDLALNEEAENWEEVAYMHTWVLCLQTVESLGDESFED